MANERFTIVSERLLYVRVANFLVVPLPSYGSASGSGLSL